MGVDARMCVRTKLAFTPEQIRALSWQIGAAFGTEAFYFKYPQPTPPQPALALVESYAGWDSKQELRAPRGGSLIAVSLTGRFWGPGYERGDLPQLLAISKWLEVKTGPGAQVWYGGDSSGCEGVLLDAEKRDEYWQHFLQRGNPYFERESFLKTRPPSCPLCAHPCTSVGGGGNQDFWRCSGCDWSAITIGGVLKPLGWGLPSGAFFEGKTAAEIIAEREKARGK